MYHNYPDIWKSHLHTALKEDGWPWDWTSLGAQTGKSQVREIQAKVIAKSDGVWAAEGLVVALSEIAGRLQLDSPFSDGARFQKGDVVLNLKGVAEEVLAWERPFLNLAAYSSGIATATAQLVAKVKRACPQNTPRVCLTRKTLPGYRDIAIHAVKCGGGFPHRVALSGGILIKENHIAVAGSIRGAVEGARNVAPHGLKLEVEVRSMTEVHEALQAGAEGVLLDNFSPDHAQVAVQFLKQQRQQLFIEISGGIHEENISDYAIEGVHILSAGSLTHSVKSADFSLLVV